MNIPLVLFIVQIASLFKLSISISLNAGCTTHHQYDNLTSQNDCSLSDAIKCRIISNCCYPDDSLHFPVTKWPRYTVRHPHQLSIVDTSLLFEDNISKNLLPAVQFSWTFPDDDLSVYHTGFLIRLISHWNRHVEQCDIFDLSESNLTDSINFAQMQFNHTMTGLKSLSNYILNVTSLPIPGNSRHQEIYSVQTFKSGKMISVVERFSPADWTTEIKVNWRNKNLYVTFKAAPFNYKFKSYSVFLKKINSNSTEVVQHLTIMEDIKKDILRLKFTNLCSGIYYISVRPDEPHRYDQKKCLCRDLKANCVDVCSQSLSTTFEIVSVVQCAEIPSTIAASIFTTRTYDYPTVSTNRKLIYISMAFFCIATLVIIAIVIVGKQDSPKESAPQQTFQFPENSINIRVTADHFNMKSNWKL